MGNRTLVTLALSGLLAGIPDDLAVDRCIGAAVVGKQPGSWFSLQTAPVLAQSFEEFRAACHDVRREAGSADDSSFECPVPGRDPTPSEAAVLSETVENLMRELRPRERDILALSLQGHSHAEIAAQVGCTERTVYRVLEHVRKRLEEIVSGEPDDRIPT